jgi:hypothetical protein
MRTEGKANKYEIKSRLSQAILGRLLQAQKRWSKLAAMERQELVSLSDICAWAIIDDDKVEIVAKRTRK